MHEGTLPDSASTSVLSVRQFAAKHPAFSEGGLRWLIFQAKNRPGFKGNGLDVAIVRVGRRVLIDERKFFEWLRDQQR
jgi:hypothetical protein